MKRQIKQALQDAERMQSFLRELEPFVYRVCFHFMGNQQLAETLAERTLLTICQELHTFDADRGALQSWVYRIILRLQESMQEETNSPSPLMSDVDRQIYVLRFLLDLPLSEVAELLRLKESVVRSRFAELRARLQANHVAGGEAV